MCLFGLHDWEIIEKVNSKEQLRENMKVEYTVMPDGTKIKSPALTWNCYNSNLVRKVCLKCGKYVDNISPMMDIILIEDKVIEDRKNRAKHLIKGKYNE